MIFQGAPLPGSIPTVTRGRNKGMQRQWAGFQMRTSIQYRCDFRDIVAKRNLNKMMRATNKALVLFWQKVLRPAHFKTPAVTEYGYQRRMTSTFKAKRKKYGHALPLVMKYALKNMTGIAKRVTATPTTGRIVMMAPGYVHVRVPKAKGGLSPDLAKELVAVSNRDAMRMARHGAKLMKDEYAAAKKAGVGKKTVKVT